MPSRNSSGRDDRDELSRLLVSIRGARSQIDAAALSGLTQAKISRAERGRFPLSTADVDRYAGALGASEVERRRAVELTEVRESTQLAGRIALVRVAAAIQERIERYQREATVIRAWQPDLIPGVLQTPEYTAAVLAGDGGEDPGPAWWVARRARTAMVGEEGREWQLLVSEAALRWPLASTTVMRAQLRHLVEVSHLPGVRIGVLDLSTPKPFAPPSAFHVYDRIVSVATEVGTSFVTDDGDVDHFVALFHRLDSVALHGDDARSLVLDLASVLADG